MKTIKTDRGFAHKEFIDRYGVKCSVQKSSLASENAIWLGIDKAEPKILAAEIVENVAGWAKYPIPDTVFINTRMHLTQKHVAELLPILQKFVETGKI